MVLLEILRRAAGAPVSYAQLHEAGIEFPASVVSELELAGVAIERWHANTRGERRLMGVRLDPSRDRCRALAASPRGVLKPGSVLASYPERAKFHLARSWPAERLARRTGSGAIMALSRTANEGRASGTRRRDAGAEHRITHQELGSRVYSVAIRVVRALGAGGATRWLAPAGLVCAVGIVAALALVQLPGASQPRHLAARNRPLRVAVSAAQHSHAPPAISESQSTAGPPLQPVSHLARPPVSVVLAEQLDTQGHDLLEAGRYGDAIAVLQRTLMATGERVQDCLQPTSETCLTYAYALYDLGSALRLDGYPAAAVPILQRRLQINNQRATVQAQLELALAQIS
jgi:hypothetical protein